MEENIVHEVTISVTELASLREDANKLRALEAAGVDNWEGYDHAMELMREWEAEEEAREG
jgi:hypothetical protein